MAPDSPAVRLGLVVGVLVLVVAFSQVFLPQVVSWNDEVSYLATASKIGREARISAAVHLPEDILRYGTDHEPIHMPAYMVALALWLKAFESSTSVLVLNQLLFAAAVVLLHRLLVRPPASRRAESALALLVLLATPLGLFYASTAMMESFVLFVGVLWFAAWIRWREQPRGLYGIYLLTALAVLTRQTLLFLFVAAVLADLPKMVSLHRRALRGRAGVLLVAWAGILAFACVAAHRRAGYYPNFFTRMGEVDSLGDKLAMVARNFADNLAQYGNWSEFPHDYFYAYGLAVFAITLVLAFRGESVERLHARMLALFWALTLLFTNLVYQNQNWRSHRLQIVCVLLGSGLIVARLCTARSKKLALPGLAGFLALDLLLGASVLRALAATRVTEQQEHPLTALGIARPGDLLFSTKDYHFLRENRDCELMWQVPEDPAELRALLDKARPRFVIAGARVDLRADGYRMHSTIAPTDSVDGEDAVRASQALRDPDDPESARRKRKRSVSDEPRFLWLRETGS